MVEAGPAAAAMASAPPCAGPDFQPRRPALCLPARACDCHAHVIGPAARYPLSAVRVYTPPDGLLAHYRLMLDAVGIERAVLVQPSIYGSDNRLLLDTLATDPQRLRGVAVAVAADDTDAATLAQWHRAGVRGLRVNLVDRHDRGGPLPMAMLRAWAYRIAPLGWHLELLVHVDEHASELPALQDLAVPVVFGHFGYLNIGQGAQSAGFKALLQLLGSGRAWVKLTGPYRLTRAPLPYADCDALAEALMTTAPQRLIWGSDWPHVMLKGKMPNDAELVDLLARWLPQEALRQQVLVDNPVVLYGFAV